MGMNFAFDGNAPQAALASGSVQSGAIGANAVASGNVASGVFAMLATPIQFQPAVLGRSGNIISYDVNLFQVPGTPSGATSFALTGLVGAVTEAINSGAPSVSVTIGASGGRFDYIVSSQINSGTVGTRYGFTLSSLGSGFLSGDGYNAYLSSGDSLWLRYAVVSGTIASGPTTRWTATGFWF